HVRPGLGCRDATISSLLVALAAAAGMLVGISVSLWAPRRFALLAIPVVLASRLLRLRIGERVPGQAVGSWRGGATAVEGRVPTMGEQGMCLRIADGAGR